ncbi:sushi, von Willebrand factor type A, EGF and pentraxin domain-containing protein 1-like isoform X2 [Dreissena polymorpha]|uniref:sushi, von Willebrand factor type A, EGF and pentraxin domain-containing protein 1-like isoform X2 n=1 Tax=Dreissena polymorpha TaxID=45954 RepID=UPI002265331F|nr:sushi, von Willebrand factor type A, EGF and pentraxin domain-containing protein 1-like isoform X2 [Dreissena polymorpha]
MMHFVTILVVLVLIWAKSSADTTTVFQHGFENCTFANNGTCGYDIRSPWEIQKGSFLLSGRHVLNGGQDDEFYALFNTHTSSIGNPDISMVSPLLPKGAACLSFYYTIPASWENLHVRIRTEDNVTVELWNVTQRGNKNWTRVDRLAVYPDAAFLVEFTTKQAPNGFVGVDDIIIESFRCDPGYSPVKSEVWAYCSSARKTLPSCEHQDCGLFHDLPHGDVDITNTTNGLIATLTCHFGYILNGSNTTECASNGEWNHTGQNCVPVDCGPLPTLSYGTASSTDTTYRSTATITCHTGYSLHGNATLTCNSNGIWGNVEGACEPLDCGTFKRPNNSFVSTTNTTYGSTATITCYIGYKLYGRNTSTCNSNGMWSNVGHLCTPVDCGRYPRPTQSWISTGPTTYNSTVIITCFPGYKLTGTGISTCEENGKWRNADQECILQTVFLKVPEANCTFEDNATCKCDSTSIVQDTNFNNTVDMPYKMNDSLHLNGQDNSCYMMAWENKLVQSQSGFALLSSTFQPGVYLISFRNLLSAGELHIIVETDFNSSKNPTHIERDQNMNETVVIAEDRQFRIAFRTNDSTNGHLGIDNVQVFKGCDLLNITNGKIIVDNHTAYFRCDEGYRLVGNSSSTCTQWKWTSEAPSCELIDCGLFPTTSHGTAWSTATTYGSTTAITCNTGYILNGSNTSTCGKSGLWTSTGQTCSPVDCGHFYTLFNGSVSTTATTFGSIATITCHTGYSLNGSSTSTCASNGQWSSTGQRCTLVDCGPFYPPTYSHLSTGYTTYNSTVTITCFPGYTLTGNRISKCDGNGQWSYKDQKCVLQTVFLEVPEESCSSDDNETCICENSSTMQPVKPNATFDMRHESNVTFPTSGQGDSCYILRWENTSVANNISFIMISSILQPGLYQIRLHQLFPSGAILVTVDTENNETYDLDMFWKYIKQDKLWINETFTFIEEKHFRFVLRANESKDGLLGIDSIQLFKACDVLNITHGHITVGNNTAFFLCDEGYRLVGNSSSTCTNWTWNSKAPTCELIVAALAIFEKEYIREFVEAMGNGPTKIQPVYQSILPCQVRFILGVQIKDGTSESI